MPDEFARGRVREEHLIGPVTSVGSASCFPQLAATESVWLQGGVKTGEGAAGSITRGLGVLMGDGGKDAAALASITARTTAESTAAAAIASYTATNSAAFAVLSQAAYSAAYALQMIQAPSGGGSGLLGDLGSIFGADGGFTLGGGGLGSAGSDFGDVFDVASMFAGFANGGNVSAGVPVITGENGRELFIPRMPGTIVQAQQTERILRGGSGQTLNQTFYVTGAIDKRTQGQVFAEAARGATMSRARGTA